MHSDEFRVMDKNRCVMSSSGETAAGTTKSAH